MALRILVTRRLPAKYIAMLQHGGVNEVFMHDSDEAMPREQLLQKLQPGCDAILCTLADKIDDKVLDAASSRLKVVSTMSVGYSHIDVPQCVSRGIRIGYTPDVLTNATADLALALVLSTARRLPEAAEAAKIGGWTTAWKPFWMTGRDVFGANVGIVGLGRIGEAIARRLKFGFNCEVSYHTRTRKAGAEAELGATWKPLDNLLAESDIVIVICALTPETRGLINARTLGLMKHDAVLVNVSRGEVVDQEALAEALRARPDFRAGLDVTTPEPLPVDSPLLKLPNCYVLPHIGSASVPCRLAMSELTVDNVLAGLEGKDMPAEVPETKAAAQA